MSPLHTCSYYCTPDADIHVMEVLCSAETTMARLAAHLRYVYGRQYLRVAPAHEADVADWQHRKGWIVPLTPFHTAAYLCWLVCRGTLVPQVSDAVASRRGVDFELAFPFPMVPTEAQLVAAAPWLQED